MATLTKKDLLEAIEDMIKDKEKYPTISYPSGVNAQRAYRNKYDDSLI